ncbi:hypothetical protein GGE65_006243 [Skermanella aerolata]|uniref:hypothetical protein n=1 Tax=Skermanella aerolata TaxID=393310 RepID=UPI003D24B41C
MPTRVIARAKLTSTETGRLVELVEDDIGRAVRIRGFSDLDERADLLLYPWHYMRTANAERRYGQLVAGYRHTTHPQAKPQPEAA